MARSALSIEMRVRRVAASTVAVEISESGLATVGMAILLGCSLRGPSGTRMVRRNNFILGSAIPAVKRILVRCTKKL